jgi:hypothetical protein
MIRYLGKILLCALSLLIGTMAGGMATAMLKLEQPKIPGQVDMRLLVLYTFVGGIVLSIALAELSRWLRGNRRLRFAVIAWFAYVWLGVNNPIEACIFTTIGGGPSMVVAMLFPCLFVAGAVTLMSGLCETPASFPVSLVQITSDRTKVQWIIRLLAAVVAFPMIYFLFGMPVGLLVGTFYSDREFGLQMPSLEIVVGVQFIRSLFALSAIVPVLIVWRGSRRRFAWTVGLSLFVVSGLYGLIQACWLPWTLRGIHGVELLLDSLIYSWILAALLLPHAPVSRSPAIEETGVHNYNC